MVGAVDLGTNACTTPDVTLQYGKYGVALDANA
jgi:hypothetical protein